MIYNRKFCRGMKYKGDTTFMQAAYLCTTFMQALQCIYAGSILRHLTLSRLNVFACSHRKVEVKKAEINVFNKSHITSTNQQMKLL